jgi:outer membrane protein
MTTVLAAVLLVWPLSAASAVSAPSLDSLGELATPFADPLFAAPEALEKGVALPGDGRPALCPTVKDFSAPLQLAEAVDLALCNNAQIKAAWAGIKVQAAATGVARAAYFPVLSGTASYREDKTRYSGAGNPTSSVDSTPLNGSAMWRIFDFGGRGASLEAANQGLAAALASHNAALQKTLAEVIQAYFDTQVAKAAWQAKEQNEEIARSTLDTAKRRETKGAGSASDTLQAGTGLAKASLERSRAQGTYLKALSVLVYAIGAPAHTRITLADDLQESGRPSVEDLETWLQEAQKLHPAIAAARAQLEAAQYRVTATRSEGLPTLDISANYYENGRLDQSSISSGTQESVVGLTLTFPIFDGFSRTYKVRGAEAQVEQKSAELLATEHQVLMEVVKTHADGMAALGNLDSSEKLLDTAQNALSNATRKYEKGAADILEILGAQTALSDARQERIRSLAEWRSARLRLLASTGLMSRTAAGP